MGVVAHISAAPNDGPFSPGTAFYALGSCPALSRQSPESHVQVKWRTPGTLSSLSVKLRANAATTASTARVRKNTANGNQVVSITALSTGHFQDLVNTDTVAAADLMSYGLTAGTGGDIAPCSLGVAFAATSGAFVARWTLYSGAVVAASGDFLHLAGGSSDELAENLVETSFPVTGTLSNGGIYLSVNTRDGAGTYRLRIDQANASIVMSSPTATAGWFEDLVNTDDVTAGQRGAWSIDPGGTTGLITLRMFTMDYTTTGRAPFATSDFNNVSAGTTMFAPIVGLGDPWDTAEADTEAKALTDHELSFLTCNITTNSDNGIQTLRLRKNNGNGNLVVSIPASTTGWFSDVVNEDIIVASDVLNYSRVSAGGSGTSTWRHIGMGGGVETVVPTVETLPATNVRSNSATLRGRIDPNGTAMDGNFRWWICAESPQVDTFTASQTIGSGGNPVIYTQALTGLTPSTTYCFQAIGNDGVDDIFGAILQFTTTGEAIFIDGTVSHPLTWMEMYIEDGDLG